VRATGRGRRVGHPRSHGTRRASGGDDSEASDASEAGPASVREHVEQLRRRYIATRNAAVEPALAAAVSPDLLAVMRRNNTYSLLLEDLYNRHNARMVGLRP
jgi:hypothetical protein